MRALIFAMAWIGMSAVQTTANADQPQSEREQTAASELAEVKQALQFLSVKVETLQRELDGPTANHQQAGEQRIYPVTYHVGDLVRAERGDFAVAWNPAPLIRYITTHIAPQQWEGARVTPVAANQTLVVAQTAEVHQELHQWLTRLREAKAVLTEVAGVIDEAPQPSDATREPVAGVGQVTLDGTAPDSNYR